MHSYSRVLASRSSLYSIHSCTVFTSYLLWIFYAWYAYSMHKLVVIE